MSVSPIGSRAVALQRPTGHTYTVKGGDTLSGIAEHFGVSLAALEAANPQIDNPDLIRPGQIIDIPDAEGHRMHTGPEGRVPRQDGRMHTGPVKAEGVALADKTPASVQGRINEGMGYFMSQGWSRAQAAGIMANLYFESARTLDPHQHQIGGGPGYGIAQWGYPRQAQFEQTMGVDIHHATYEQELQFVQWELTHTEQRAANKLRATDNAFDAGVSFCRYYERPADSYQPPRGRIAQDIYKNSNPTQGPGPAPSPTPSPSPSPAPAPAAHDYTVQRGDTMSGIASRNGVSLSALEAANPQINNPNLIHPGQTIHIPGEGDNAAPPRHQPATHDYTVRRGDTMSGIAARNGVSLSALERANPQIDNPNLIQVGQTIHVPGAGSVNPGGPVHGTNAASIAHGYYGMYASQLENQGVIIDGVNTKLCCANFVTAMLIEAGAVPAHGMNFVQRVNVSAMSDYLQAHGWSIVPRSQARPGDVWVAGDEGHTELVYANNGGSLKLIGSNNHPVWTNQQVNYSYNVTSGYVLAPPR